MTARRSGVESAQFFLSLCGGGGDVVASWTTMLSFCAMLGRVSGKHGLMSQGAGAAATCMF